MMSLTFHLCTGFLSLLLTNQCLKQYKCPYYLTVLEIRNPKWFSLGKIKMLAGLFPSAGSRGIFISSLFQLLATTHIPWLMVPSSIFKASNTRLSVLTLPSLWFSSVSLFHFEGLLQLRWTHLSQVPAIGKWASLGGHYSAYRSL